MKRQQIQFLRETTSTNIADLGIKPLSKDRIDYLSKLANIRMITHDDVQIFKPTKKDPKVRVSTVTDDRILNLANALAAFIQKR